MDITGYVVLVGGLGVGGIFSFIVLKELLGIKLPESIARLFSKEKHSSLGENDVSKELKKYDVILVGEFHPAYLKHDKYISKEKIEKEINKEIEYIEKCNPDILFFEGPDIKYVDKRIVETAYKKGLKPIMIEDLKSHKELENFYKNIVECDEIRDKLKNKIKKNAEEIGLSKEQYMNLGGNVVDAYIRLSKIEGELYKKLMKIIEETTPKREEYFGRVIIDTHQKNPNKKIMMITGAKHIAQDSGILSTLKDSGLTYETIVVGEEVKKEYDEKLQKEHELKK